MWTCAEQLLSHLERVQLSSKSIIKLVPASSLGTEGKACFFTVVAIVKEVVRKTRMKGVATGNFISSLGLLKFFASLLKRKIMLDKKSLSFDIYGRIWKNVTQMLRISDPT